MKEKIKLFYVIEDQQSANNMAIISVNDYLKFEKSNPILYVGTYDSVLDYVAEHSSLETFLSNPIIGDKQDE